jgi:HAD superfamily hydrolase (TIGR01549 family)
MKKIKKDVSKYKAIIFDLDGTLINSLPYHLLAFKDMMKEHNIKIKESKMKVLLGIPTPDILKELKVKYKFKENLDDLREERRYHYFKYLGNKDIVFKGVFGTIKKLKKRYKIAIATGSSYVVYSHSTKKDFQELFDFVSTINDVKNGKPDPDQFFYVAKKLNVKINEVLVVGDSIYDAIAAQKANMDHVAVTSGYTSRDELKKYKPIKILKSVNQIIKIL